MKEAPRPFTYEESSAALQDAVRYSIPAAFGAEVAGEGSGDGSCGRVALSVLATPKGESGRTIILVHGFKMHAASWSLVWNRLRRRGHRLVALDLPGHGASGLPAGPCEALGGLPALATALRRAVDFLEVENGAVIGHSLGGFVAIKYLAAHAAHAERKLPLGFACVACTAGAWRRLVGGAGGNWHGNLLMNSGLFDLLMSSDWFAPLLMAKKFGQFPSLPAVRVVVEASRMGASRRVLKPLSDLPWEEDLHPELQNLTLPSTVIVGELDDHHPHPMMSEAVRDGLAASGLLRAYTVVSGAGHFLPLLQPDEVVASIEKLWEA